MFDFRIIIERFHYSPSLFSLLSVRAIFRCVRANTDGMYTNRPPPIKPRLSAAEEGRGGGRARERYRGFERRRRENLNGRAERARGGWLFRGTGRVPLPVRSSSRCRMRPGCVPTWPTGRRARRGLKHSRATLENPAETRRLCTRGTSDPSGGELYATRAKYLREYAVRANRPNARVSVISDSSSLSFFGV